ncbi:MAG: hypothetical protein Q7S47_02875, partial [bacterium]|nr:hypothetical protein [bacterium]
RLPRSHPWYFEIYIFPYIREYASERDTLSSIWGAVQAFGDILGVSFYGISYENSEYVTHANSISANWQTRAANIGKPVWLTELQAEPWGPYSNKDLSYEESLKSMSPSRLKDHLEFVTNAGFKDVYLWGAEWMLWMRNQGHSEMWETIKPLFKNG